MEIRVADLADRLWTIVTERSRETIAVMLVVSLLLSSGVAAVEDSTSLEQFETNSEASQKQTYVDENFGGADDTTAVQVIVRGEDVLTKDALLATIRLQERLRANETVNETLGDDAFNDLSTVVAETDVRVERAEELRADAEELQAEAERLNESREELEARGEKLQERADELNESRDELEARGEKLQERADELNETRRELQADREELEARGKALREDGEELQADAQEFQREFQNLQIPITEIEERRQQLEERRQKLQERREAFNESRDELEARGQQLRERAEALNESRAELEAEGAELEKRGEALKGDQEELEAHADELEAKGEKLEERREDLQERQNALAEFELSIPEQREHLASMNQSEIDDILETLLNGSSGGSGVYTFLPTDFDRNTTRTDARTLFVTQQTRPPEEIEGEVSDRTIASQRAVEAIVEDTFGTAARSDDAGTPRESFGSGVAAAQSTGTATPTAAPTPGQDRTATSAGGNASANGENATGAGGTDGADVGDDADASTATAIDGAVVFGEGVVFDEINRSMSDSFVIVLPLSLLFVTVVLTVAYRDLLDIALGVFGILMVLLWTFGFMGWTGIEFTQIILSVPALLVGVSIDYAIHVVMRHRERRTEADGEPRRRSMRVALGGVGVALLWVTTTTAIGFLSNFTSPIQPLRMFGVVSAVGIAAAFVVFTTFVPALKVELDERLSARGYDRETRALGADGSRLESTLDRCGRIAAVAPWGVVFVALVLTTGGVVGAVQIDTSFEQEEFIAEEPADWMQELPEPFAPGSYTAKEDIAYVNERFVRQDMQGRVLVEGPVARNETLDRVAATQRLANEQETVQKLPDGRADLTSPLSVMRDVAAENATFNQTFVAADTDGDGVPDRNVETLYDELFAANADRANTVVHRTEGGEYEAVQVIVSPRGDAASEAATTEIRTLASEVDGDGYEASATGQVVVTEVVEEELFRTIVESLAITLGAVFVFLMVGYRRTYDSASLGFVTLVPTALSVTWILGTMYVLEIPFNVMTGTITSLTIGLGVDYNIHMSERYVEERRAGRDLWEAVSRSVTGTGSALLGSATTTAGGFGVLALAILPSLQQFGIITALTIVYAFLGSVLLLPSLLVIWTRLTEPVHDTQVSSSDPDGSQRDDSNAGDFESDDSIAGGRSGPPLATDVGGGVGSAPRENSDRLSRARRLAYRRLGLPAAAATVFASLQALDGGDPELVAEKTGLDREAVDEAIASLVDFGMLEVASRQDAATAEAADPEGSPEYVPIDHEVAVDWLRSGVDAEQSTLGSFESVGKPAAKSDFEAASTD